MFVVSQKAYDCTSGSWVCIGNEMCVSTSKYSVTSQYLTQRYFSPNRFGF